VTEHPHPIPLDPDEPFGATAAPEAVTEQPDLSFERHPEAKWIGADPMGLRLLAVALTRRARRRRGEAVQPLPWLAIAVTTGMVGLVIVAIWVVAAAFSA
jgi:hypothetical protein